MISDDDCNGDSCLAKASQLQGKFALPCRVRRRCPVDIACQEHKIEFLVDCMVKETAQATEEILQARMKPGTRVEATVIFDPKM